MSQKNDVVIIELDRPRELRYGHKALKTLGAMGIDIEGIEISNLGLAEIEKCIYCGLLSDARKAGEELKLDQMEDLLDLAPFAHIVEKMTEAFEAAFGSFGEQVAEGNQSMPAEEPAVVSGTGKKA